MCDSISVKEDKYCRKKYLGHKKTGTAKDGISVIEKKYSQEEPYSLSGRTPGTPGNTQFEDE